MVVDVNVPASLFRKHGRLDTDGSSSNLGTLRNVGVDEETLK